MKTCLLSITTTLLVLVACPFLACAQSSASPAADTGLEGVISISPTQGGPIRQGVPNSRPLAHTGFVVKQGERTVTSFVTDEQGHFRVSLPAGHYTIVKQERKSGVGFFGPFEADVTEGKMKSVQWTCDSGIR